VGALFLGAAALFTFSKKLPKEQTSEAIEKAPKAVRTLLIMTFFIFLCMTPIFMTYKDTFVIADRDVEMDRMRLLTLTFLIIIGSLLYVLFQSSKNKTGWG